MRFAVVFDTRVLFSAIGWGGKPGLCVQLARDGHIDALICVEILDELSEKLTLKTGFTSQEIARTLASLPLFFQPIKISGAMKGLCSDPKDDMVIECALLAGATHVVSSDKKHLLSLQQFFGIQIVSPAEFLRVIDERQI